MHPRLLPDGLDLSASYIHQEIDRAFLSPQAAAMGRERTSGPSQFKSMQNLIDSIKDHSRPLSDREISLLKIVASCTPKPIRRLQGRYGICMNIAGNRSRSRAN
jgi:hypothetical protein